jgi:hypothetical protein
LSVGAFCPFVALDDFTSNVPTIQPLPAASPHVATPHCAPNS